MWSLIQKELTGKEEGEEEAGWLRALWSTVVDQALATGTQERKVGRARMAQIHMRGVYLMGCCLTPGVMLWWWVQALSLLLLQRFTVGLPSSSLSVVLSPQVRHSLTPHAAGRVVAQSCTAGLVVGPQVLRVLIGALSTAGSADQLLAPLAKQTLEVLVNNVK